MGKIGKTTDVKSVEKKNPQTDVRIVTSVCSQAIKQWNAGNRETEWGCGQSETIHKRHPDVSTRINY